MKKFYIKKALTEKELKDIAYKFSGIEPLEARLKELEQNKDIAIERVRDLKSRIEILKKEIYEVLEENVS